MSVWTYQIEKERNFNTTRPYFRQAHKSRVYLIYRSICVASGKCKFISICIYIYALHTQARLERFVNFRNRRMRGPKSSLVQQPVLYTLGRIGALKSYKSKWDMLVKWERERDETSRARWKWIEGWGDEEEEEGMWNLYLLHF